MGANIRTEFVESLSRESRVKSASKSPSKARKAKAKDERANNSLRTYLQSMGGCETFSSDEEQRAAIGLRLARCQRWAALVSYPPLFPAVRQRIDERLEVDAELAALLDQVGVAAEAFRKRRTLANESAFAKLCAAAGEALPEVDVDSELAERLILDIESIANNHREGLLLEVSRMPGDSRPFRIFHDRCRLSAARVRKTTNDFAKANLRLVVSLARRLSNGRMPLQDVIQEGNIGLLKAIERFDHRKGFRFSTYASWWIRHSISRAIYNKGRQVRLPVHVYDLHQKMTRVRRRYEAEQGRVPTFEELADAIGAPLAKIEKIASLELGPIVSLDAPLSRTDDRAGVDLLEDQDSPTPGWELEVEELELGLEDALDALRPMEADILRRRYGLDGVEKETLREIGERYALSRERIRQLQERAVKRMREEFAERSLM